MSMPMRPIHVLTFISSFLFSKFFFFFSLSSFSLQLIYVDKSRFRWFCSGAGVNLALFLFEGAFGP